MKDNTFISKEYNLFMNSIKDFTKLVPMNKNDPNRFDHYEIIGGINRLSDLINSINRDIEGRVLLVVSIIISTILGYFIAKEKVLQAINLSLFLAILLILSIIKESLEKIKFKNMLLIAYNNAIKNGIPLKNKFTP